MGFRLFSAAVGLYVLAAGVMISRDRFGSSFFGRPIDLGPYHAFVGMFLVFWGLRFIYLAARRRKRP